MPPKKRLKRAIASRHKSKEKAFARKAKESRNRYKEDAVVEPSPTERAVSTVDKLCESGMPKMIVLNGSYLYNIFNTSGSQSKYQTLYDGWK